MYDAGQGKRLDTGYHISHTDDAYGIGTVLAGRCSRMRDSTVERGIASITSLSYK